jgi:hypothetical protein
MAASEVQIANRALQKLGEQSIIALNEDTTRAQEMNRAFGSVRDGELNRHRWRFSFERVSLPALVAVPIADYRYQYQLPGDFIRLLEGGSIASVVDMSDYHGGTGMQYSIEGRKLLSNIAAPITIRYIKRVTDTTLYTPAFDEAFAARLAYETCERITQSPERKKDCLTDYRIAIREAVLAQALEVASEAQADDSWVLARLG